MITSQFGVLGLGVMGQSLALHLVEQGYRIAAYNRMAPGEESVIPDFLQVSKNLGQAVGFTDLRKFVEQLERPRKLLLMVKAGPLIDQILEQLTPFLSAGDILLDGGNSHYSDTERRQKLLGEQGIHWLGVGISGGEEGARHGASIMAGGDRDAYQQVEPILQALAAPGIDKPCCAYIGPGGAGHFVKMVHNGIEYAEMQLLAELLALLSPKMDYQAISYQFQRWNQDPEHQSYLLEITTHILRQKEGDQFLLDLILDKAGNKGTGAWSSQAAMQLGYPASLMSSAVYARYVSSMKERRVRLQPYGAAPGASLLLPTIDDMEAAYFFARRINHWQGFSLIEETANAYRWEVDLGELARIWTNGCIIRSGLMEALSGILKEASLEKQPAFLKALQTREEAVVRLLQAGLASRIYLPVFSAALQFWVGITSAQSTANLIQAQRDFFGAHTYQRIDRPEEEFFHTNWSTL